MGVTADGPVDLKRVEALLDALGQRVGLSDRAVDVDPGCVEDADAGALTRAQRECADLGLEGWVGHRGATVVAFRSKELRRLKAQLDGVVGLLLESKVLAVEDERALCDVVYTMINESEDLAVRTYLAGFVDGRVLRLVSEWVPDDRLPEYNAMGEKIAPAGAATGPAQAVARR